jgi:hypothetical protein
MTTTTTERPERQEIEALLPWHAAGTLSRRDSARVDEAIANDPELARQFAIVREELGETIRLNESLGTPSTRALERLMASIETEGDAAQRTRRSFGFSGWITERLSSLSPRTLAWSATTAVLAIALQAGLLAGFLINERGDGAFETASYRGLRMADAGSYVLIGFAPQVTTSDMSRFLESHKLTLVDGPRAGGLYKARAAVPKEQLAGLVKQLQQESGVIRFASPTQ